MNRRQFLTSSVASASVILLALPETGCSQSQLAQLTQVLGQDTSNVAKAMGNTSLSTQIDAATAAAVSAINGWKNGTPATDIIQALGIVEADLNLIPIASPYIPLIDIAIATVQSILALLPAPAPVTLQGTRMRTVYLGHPAPKTAKAFKAQWNAVVDKNPKIFDARDNN